TRFGPSAGHSFKSPVSRETSSRRAPRKVGHSMADAEETMVQSRIPAASRRGKAYMVLFLIDGVWRLLSKRAAVFQRLTPQRGCSWARCAIQRGRRFSGAQA